MKIGEANKEYWKEEKKPDVIREKEEWKKRISLHLDTNW